MMIVYVLLLSYCVASICVLAESQLQPIQTEDLKSIVDAVKEDVDRHLRITSAAHRLKAISSPSSPKEVQKSVVVDDVANLLQMIQDSMNRHLVKNLGQPSDCNEGTLISENSVGLSTESAPDQSSEETSQSTAEEISKPPAQAYEIHVGSLKGVPGVDFPDYTDIPITTFKCFEKTYLPGFYADLDTGCQVFHVCWPDRRESFLCPMGTTFNQALLVCDYWYNSNCSLAPHYYSVNAEMNQGSPEAKNESVSSMISNILEKTKLASTQQHSLSKHRAKSTTVESFIAQFMPIRAKIVVYPETASKRAKIVASASVGRSNIRDSSSKSHQKYTSKNSRLPLSSENTNAMSDAQIDELRWKINKLRISEELDRALMHIKEIEKASNLLKHTESIVKFIKKWNLMMDKEPLEQINPEIRKVISEQDMEIKTDLEELREVGNNILLLISALKDITEKFELRKYDAPQEVHKPETLETESLPHLNPRFIVKPATEETFRLQKLDELSTFVKERVKRSTILHDKNLKINPGTKAALMKNYLKLIQTKRA